MADGGTPPASPQSPLSKAHSAMAFMLTCFMPMTHVITKDYDSYLEYSVVVTATKDLNLADIVLTVKPANDTARMMCGMGPDGSYLHDIRWNWDTQNGNNRLWMGRLLHIYIYYRLFKVIVSATKNLLEHPIIQHPPATATCHLFIHAGVYDLY